MAWHGVLQFRIFQPHLRFAGSETTESQQIKHEMIGQQRTYAGAGAIPLIALPAVAHRRSARVMSAAQCLLDASIFIDMAVYVLASLPCAMC